MVECVLLWQHCCQICPGALPSSLYYCICFPGVCLLNVLAALSMSLSLCDHCLVAVLRCLLLLFWFGVSILSGKTQHTLHSFPQPPTQKRLQYVVLVWGCILAKIQPVHGAGLLLTPMMGSIPGLVCMREEQLCYLGQLFIRIPSTSSIGHCWPRIGSYYPFII